MDNLEQKMKEIATEVYNDLGTRYGVATVPNHTHTGTDTNQLNPATFMGWPVFQVADATVAPTDTPQQGIFRFYVDTTPRYRLWAYLIYTATNGTITRAWKVVQLTATGGASPGSPDTSVQFNDGGNFAGNAGLVFNKTTHVLTNDTQIKIGGNATAAGKLTLLEDSDTGTNSVTITAPTLAGDYTLTLPIDDGTPSQVLTTDGSGILSWTTPTTGSPGGSNGDLQINASGVFGTIGGLNLSQTGNARGTPSLDIQAHRTNVTEVASASYSFAIGADNTASGVPSVAFGYANFATTANAVGIGIGNTGSGNGASGIGVNNTVSGASSVGCGVGNNLSTDNNMAFGASNTISGTGGGLAVGLLNTVSGQNAGAFGKSNTATAQEAYVIGSTSSSSNLRAHAFGWSANVTADYALAIGNAITNTTALTIEIGISSNLPSSATGSNQKLQITNKGNYGFNGVSYQDGIGVIFLADAITPPTTTPTGGGILYSTGGALHWLGSSGTDTPIAPA